MRMIHFGWFIFCSWLVLALGACSSDAGSGDDGSGGVGGDDGPAASPIQRVEITPGSVTFWAEGQGKALSAQVLGIDDEVLEVALTWTSSDPSVVSVDSDGLLTATAALGSATITAEADGVADSVVALVVVAQPDTVFVEDENVVGDYTLVDPDAPREPGLLYEVTLTGLAAPEVGQILLGTEEQPVGGKVTAVRTENGNLVVTLELLSIDALLVDVRIDETIDLSKVAVEFNEEVLEDYEAVRLGDGSYAFTLKNQNKHVSKSDASFGPLKCTSDLTQFPLSFSALPTSFGLDFDPDFLIDYQSDNGGLHKLALKGDAKASFKVSPTLSFAIEGKASCTVELLVIPLPIGGPIALVLGGQVPVGVGFEIGGKITAANVGAEASSEVTATSEIGVECPGGGDCSLLTAFMLDGKAEYQWVLPQSANLDDNLRIEASLSGFVFSKVALGNRFVAALRFDTFDVRGGLALGANLATVAGQIDDPDYKSDYALTQVLSAGLASDAQMLFNFLNINVSGLELKVTNLLYESPKAVSAKANVETFEQGDDIDFTVTLDPASLDFLLLLDVIPYNIDDIVIYRQTMTGPVEVARTTPSVGTTEVTLTWTADEAGNIEDNFYAFVDTKALTLPIPGSSLDLPFIDELELGKVTSDDASGAIVFNLGPLVAVVNPDGSGLRTLTAADDVPWNRVDGPASWSPDRSQIAFARGRESNDNDIWIMNADGSNQVNLTPQVERYFEGKPSWSPDGTQLAFYLRFGGIYVIDINGGNPTNIFDMGQAPSDPAWSPDGASIAFVLSEGPQAPRDVYTMRPDGTGLVRVTNHAAGFFPSSPSWSPDGSKIVYNLDNRDLRWEVFVINRDGSSSLNLTNTSTIVEVGPSFSPDGQQIVVGSPAGLVIMNADGTGESRVIPNTVGGNSASWFQ